MTLDQDVAELQAQAERLAGEISRKAKEMAFLDEIEVQRIQRQEHSAKARYLGRQASVNPGNFGKTIPSRK
jgi:hypothetical protein